MSNETSDDAYKELVALAKVDKSLKLLWSLCLSLGGVHLGQSVLGDGSSKKPN